LDDTLVMAKFINYLVKIMEFTRNHWRKFHQYWALLDYIVTNCGHSERLFLQVYLKIVMRLLDYYMGPYSPLWHRGETERMTIGVKGVQSPELANFMWLLAHMVCACHNNVTRLPGIPHPQTAYPNCPLLHIHVQDIDLLSKNDFFWSLVKQAYNPQANALILSHLSWEDSLRSNWVMSAMQELFKRADAQIHFYTTVLEAVLSLRDTKAPWRTALLLNYKGRGLFHMISSNSSELREKFGPTLFFLMKLIKTNPVVAGWIKKTHLQFGQWVKDVFEDLSRYLNSQRSQDYESGRKSSDYNALKSEFFAFVTGTKDDVKDIYEFDIDISSFQYKDITPWQN